MRGNMLEMVLISALKPNDWNPNKVDPINQEKLERSLSQYGQQMPLIIREVMGEKEIVDGEHRWRAAMTLGWESIQAINLGEVSVEEAMRKTLIANSRYGQDDNAKLFEILSTEGVFETAEDILNTMPIDETEIAGLFSGADIDFSVLDEDEDKEIDLGIDATDSTPSGPSTRIMRFKLENEDADYVQSIIEKEIASSGLTDSDALTKAGDALISILREKVG